MMKAVCTHCGSHATMRIARQGWRHCKNCRRKFLMASANPRVQRQWDREAGQRRAGRRGRADLERWLSEQRAAEADTGEYARLRSIERDGGPRCTELGSTLRELMQFAELGVWGSGQRHILRARGN